MELCIIKYVDPDPLHDGYLFNGETDAPPVLIPLTYEPMPPYVLLSSYPVIKPKPEPPPKSLLQQSKDAYTLYLETGDSEALQAHIKFASELQRRNGNHTY